MATTSMPASPLSLSRGLSVDATALTRNSSPRRRNSLRSQSPSAERFHSVATPTFDNRRRRSLTPQKKGTKNRTEKAPNDRKTKIQVCVRVRPILPSDFKKSGIPPIPEERLQKSSSARQSHVKAKVTRSASKRLSRETSRLSTVNSNTVDDMNGIVDTEPAWEMENDTVAQALHTNPDDNRKNAYTFDHTFGPGSDTSEIYHDTVQDSVISTMEGYHASVFAYGQTATGKTFTMTGGGKSIETKEGIVQLAIKDCFDFIQNQKNDAREYLLRVSFMEIYNEVINDLLASPNRAQPMMTTSRRTIDSTPPPPSTIRIFESKNDGVVIRGLKEEIVTCPEQVFALLAAGERRRQTGTTSMNKHSSRSHSIFRLIVESRRRLLRQTSMGSSDTSSVADSIASSTFAPTSTSGPVRVSSLSLVDLAGSESVKNTGSTGTRQKEGQYINKSLLTLGHVVYKLADASSKNGGKGGKIDTMHIPYRDSKLTRLLQPSLSGNAQICIICNISPLSKHIEESHLTLKFASRAKKIKQHATITEVVDEKTLLENYREEIEELKSQLKEAREVQERANETTSDPGVKTATSIDDDDVDVLTQAVSNLERLILKTTTTEEKKRRKKRRDAMLKMRTEQGIPATINGGIESNANSRDADTLLNGVLGVEGDDNIMLNSLSLDDFPGSKNAVYKEGSSVSLLKDDQSLGSGSLGDESTLLEGKKLVTELHRIQKLLGTVLAKKGSVGASNGKNSIINTMSHRGSLVNNENEVERLRAQLHEQAVHTSLRKADSTFLQSQLQEKDILLRDISQILEAVEKRQVELEAENIRLKREWTRAVDNLRSKDSESLILEKLIKKRETELKKLKEDHYE